MPPKKANALEGGLSRNPRKSAKSRNGCGFCKVKRLKCDETKPECLNCTKRELRCPGYQQNLRWSTKYETLRTEGGPSESTLHPSIEHQFAAIDPSSFSQAGHVFINNSPQIVDQTPAGGVTNLELAGDQEILGEIDQTPVASNTNLVSIYDRSNIESLDIPDEWNDHGPPVHNNETRIVPFEAFDQPFANHPSVQADLADQDVQTIVRQKSNSSAQWRSLLRSYYRISAPSVSRELHNEATALVEHYFRDVCVVFSSFDSAMNPFRTVIARLWDNSSSIFYAIQSMAAAHLANYVPNMKVKGLAMQRKAYECLQQELKLASINRTMDDKLLLTVLLLGLTACWHDSSDLGAAHLAAARTLIHPRLLRDDTLQNAESTRNDQFFAEALIYWEMCMSFVSQEAFTPNLERRLPGGHVEEEHPPDRKVFPHPWTGIAPRVQMLFAEVGRLVRHQCNMNMMFFNMGEIADDSAVTSAEALEDELISIRLPKTEDLIDVQDERTSKADFVRVAEATRCAALLEIYCVFPTILDKRLSTPRDGSASDSATIVFPFEKFQQLRSDLEHTPWLTSLATHILDLLASVPSSSGTRPLQLIMLVTAASELRFSGPVVSSPGLSASTSYDVDVARARGFAMARLNELASRLPSKPVLKIIELVREVWRRNDAGEDVFWMNVMTENGWETIMG